MRSAEFSKNVSTSGSTNLNGFACSAIIILPATVTQQRGASGIFLFVDHQEAPRYRARTQQFESAQKATKAGGI